MSVDRKAALLKIPDDLGEDADQAERLTQRAADPHAPFVESTHVACRGAPELDQQGHRNWQRLRLTGLDL